VVAILDLDTTGRGAIATEMGDALRSWCNSNGELGSALFDTATYEAAVKGYFSTATFLTDEEKKYIPLGIKTIALELAARFLSDAFEEAYFRFDPAHFSNLAEQNFALAKVQTDLYFDVVKQKL